MWWIWIIGGLLLWLTLGFGAAVVFGRGVRLADSRSVVDGRSFAGEVAAPEPSAGTVAAPPRRRTVPLPPLGIALAATAVALETTGFLIELTGRTGSAARLMSMDAIGSLPRLFVAALFVAAAVAAFAGAGRAPGRRTWWLVVGLVALGIGAVKAGGTVHVTVIHALRPAVGNIGVVALSVLMAAGVIGALWLLSRNERRDRRRILGTLALYAGASVGLSAVSSAVGGTWAVTATYLEESGEALAGVAFLVGVLIGVAPKVALPAAWALRRTADAHSLELPEVAVGRRTVEGSTRG